MTAQGPAAGPIEFPEGFLWGSATSAHQIEGGNVNNDWWAWEHDPDSGCVESSGDACDSWHRWPEDVDLVADLGLGAYRFSLEWSRIEPAEGEWSVAALDHYRRMCAACLGRGIQPVVTFHHFTTPVWLSARGGWEAPDAPERFARFVERAAAHLGDLIGWACTINEPNVVGVMGYTLGAVPPGGEGRPPPPRGGQRGHGARPPAGRRGAAGRARATSRSGLTLSMAELVAGRRRRGRPRTAAEDLWRTSFCEATGGDDFVGVQCYTRMRFGPDGPARPEAGVPATQMGYEFWPQVVDYTVRRAAAVTGIPVVVTENGIGTDDDTQRVDYFTRALTGLRRCLDDGIDVRGYFAWSLLDNFEWSLGYRPDLRPGRRRPVDLRTASQAERPVVRRGGPSNRPGHRRRRLTGAPPAPGDGRRSR